MKAGRTLNEVAVEIDRQLKTKRDLIADTRSLTLYSGQGSSALAVSGNGRFALRDLAHEQIAERLKIPKVYYDRMKSEAPALLDVNINRWFNQNPERRLVRTIDGQMRAFLSEKYRPLDNYDLVEVVLPVITKLGCRLESCELTERRLYIKAVNERIQTDVKKGDIVQAGVVISNSEVGCGSVSVAPMLFRLSCLNGAIMNDMAMKKYHVGRSNGEDESGAAVFFKDATRQADDKAFWMKIKDTVEGSLTEVIFMQIVNKMRRAQDIELKDDPVKAVEVLGVRHSLTQEEQSGVLKFLVQGGDLSLYGMINAITRESQDVADYDRATELERLGGTLLTVGSILNSN